MLLVHYTSADGECKMEINNKNDHISVIIAEK